MRGNENALDMAENLLTYGTPIHQLCLDGDVPSFVDLVVRGGGTEEALRLVASLRARLDERVEEMYAAEKGSNR